MKVGRHLFTSESVTEGHPDKICDQISDAVLDAIYKDDPQARVACESFTKTGLVIVGGEITTSTYIDINKIVRNTLKDIGYTKAAYGIEHETCAVLAQIEEQSPEIAAGVDERSVEGKESSEQGAGDQGMMFGYATNETSEYMPLPIMLAHKLTMKLAETRKSNELSYLRPDGKSQVTVEYEGGKPVRAHTVLISTQHDEGIEHGKIKQDILQKISSRQILLKSVRCRLLMPSVLRNLSVCWFNVLIRIRLRRRKLQNWCIIIFHLNRQISSRSWILEDLSIKRQQSTVILAEMTRTLPGKESTR